MWCSVFRMWQSIHQKIALKLAKKFCGSLHFKFFTQIFWQWKMLISYKDVLNVKWLLFYSRCSFWYAILCLFQYLQIRSGLTGCGCDILWYMGLSESGGEQCTKCLLSFCSNLHSHVRRLHILKTCQLHTHVYLGSCLSESGGNNAHSALLSFSL